MTDDKDRTEKAVERKKALDFSSIPLEGIYTKEALKAMDEQFGPGNIYLLTVTRLDQTVRKDLFTIAATDHPDNIGIGIYFTEADRDKMVGLITKLGGKVKEVKE